MKTNRDDILSVVVSVLMILFTVLFTIHLINSDNIPEEFDIPYWPETPEPTYMYADSTITYWEWDSYMDSVNMDCGE